MPRVHEGEFGFRLTFVTGYDFTDFDTLQVRFEKPDGTKVTKSASTTDPSAGELYYTVEEDFFDDPGKYRAQPIINFEGKTLKGEPITIPVLSAL